jgi:hypothetical protein
VETVEPGTIDDLVDDSHALSLPATPRMIRDWSERGLLGYPSQEGRGKGRGQGSRKATYGANQRLLFRNLLQLRASGYSVRELALVPIYLWLYWGDSYVDLAQLRRALRTWAPSPIMRRWQAEASADRIVRQFADPAATAEDRAALRDVIIQSCLSPTPNVESVWDALNWVFDPHGEKARERDPQFDRLAAIVSESQRVVADLEELPAPDFLMAKLGILMSRRAMERSGGLPGWTQTPWESLAPTGKLSPEVGDSGHQLIDALAKFYVDRRKTPQGQEELTHKS